MRTYWDLTEPERAALTVEQVEAFGKIELMQAGVVSPEPPVLLPVDPPAVEKFDLLCARVSGTRYGHSDTNVAFTTPEAYRAFLALNPVYVEHDYDADAEVGTVLSVNEQVTKAQSIQVLPRGVAEIHRAALKRCKENAEANRKEEERAAKERKVADQTLEFLWNDYKAVRLRAAKAEQVREKFEEYVRLSDGDSVVAFRFLRKTYGDELVYLVFPPQAEPVEAKS